MNITRRKNDEDLVFQQKNELKNLTDKIATLNMDLERKVEERTRMLKSTLSQLEQSKKEISDALENEKQMGKLKSEFVTIASHEFRTPLSTILSSVYLLEKYNDEPAPEQRMRHIQRIKNSVLGLKGILDDFLSVGKLEEGKIKNIDKEIDPSEIQRMIGVVIEDMEQLLKAGQRIIFRWHSYSKIKVDLDILKNIMINLLSNAIKYSGCDSIIHIDCATGKRELAIAVRDQGIGISTDDMKHLTERFFRAKNVTSIQGTGLGLHIIERYLNLIHGRMEIKSILNEGSCFTIYLPFT